MTASVTVARWTLSVPAGVATCLGAGLVLESVVGGRESHAGWQANVGGAAILLVGSVATGTLAHARSRSDWIRAVVLTFAGILAFVVVLFAYVAATEPPH